MTEHTDKAPQKSGKKPPAKRAGRTRAPGGKKAKRPSDKAAATETAAREMTASGNGAAAATASAKSPDGSSFDPNYPGPKSLAPDPATVTFGSNRPIVAAPPKLPESSGLKFSGPSAGELKASGPQPTSPKASGLTFTSAKTGASSKLSTSTKLPASGAPSNGSANAGKEPLRKTEAKTLLAKAPETQLPEAKKSDAKAPLSKAGETKPIDPKKPTTKPAIAPPVSVRRFDKERSTSGFVIMLFALTVMGGGLAVWMKLSSETPPAAVNAPQEAAATPAAPEAAVPATGEPATAEPRVAAKPAEPEAPVRYGRSVRAPETPGPLASTATAGAATAASGGLTAQEIGEVQRLLSRLDLNPGSEIGVVTPETVAAIRSYQEMAGLPADGEVNAALLDELRTVVELYGG